MSDKHRKAIFTDVKKRPRAMGIFVYIVSAIVIIFSLCFAPERIVFSDTAFYFHEIVMQNKPYIATYRFVSIFAQVLPCLGLLAGLSFKTLLYSYSLNFTLIPVAAAFFCYYRLKDPVTATAILLYYVLMSRELFYYPVSEFQMGLIFLFVYHAWFLRYTGAKGMHPAWYYIGGTLLIATILYSHPLSLSVWAAWMIWMFFTSGAPKKHWIFPAVLTGALEYIKPFFRNRFAAQYEGAKTDGLDNFQNLEGFWDYTMTTSFLNHTTSYYFYAYLILLAVLVLFILQKKWLHVLLSVGILGGFFLLVTVSFKGDPYNYYFEHIFLPLPFFLSLFFCTYVLPACRKASLQVVLLSVIFSLGLIQIFNNSVAYQDRLSWYRNYLDVMAENNWKKAVISRDNFTAVAKGVYWSVSSETLLLSSLEGPENSRTIYAAEHTDQLKKKISDPRIFLYDGWEVSLSEFPGKYFLQDTLHPYVILDSMLSRPVMDSLNTANLHRRY